LYTTYKEKGCFMVALEKDKAGVDPDVVWTLSSRLKRDEHLCRYDHLYEMYVTRTEGDRTREASFTNSVASYFDENGYICRDIYDQEFIKVHSKLLEQDDKKTK